MLVHDACANIVRIDRRLSDRGHGGAERIHGMTARRDDMTVRSDARDSVPNNGTGGNRQKNGLIISLFRILCVYLRACRARYAYAREAENEDADDGSTP